MNVNQLSRCSTQWQIDADSKAKARTRQLLESSIISAYAASSSNCRPPALTPLRYVWRLVGMYHLCHSTPQLMKQAAQRFASAGRWKEARWAADKAIEEQGHDQLALLDIESLGYDAEALVKAAVPPAAAHLVDYFTRSVQASDPINCIAYSFTLERIAIGIAENHIKAVEAMLLQAQATRCLRVHSSSGNDVKHVEETLVLISDLAFEQQLQVAEACYQVALLCINPPRESYASEAELEDLLRPLKQRT